MRFQQEEVDSAWCSPRVVARAGEPPWLLVVRPVGWAQAKRPFPSRSREIWPNVRKPTGVGRMKGVIWHVYRNQEKGMIRGDDGEQVSFRKSALHGVDFRSLSSGQRVSYRIQEGWLGKEAVEVRPLPMERIAGAG